MTAQIATGDGSAHYSTGCNRRPRRRAFGTAAVVTALGDVQTHLFKNRLSFVDEGDNTKNFLYVMGVVIAAALAGCVSASKVAPTGNGTYVIQGRAVGPWNVDKDRAKALKMANDYCAKQGKRVVLHNIDEAGHAALLGARATITFECET